jgi:hypothetical protein
MLSFSKIGGNNIVLFIYNSIEDIIRVGSSLEERIGIKGAGIIMSNRFLINGQSRIIIGGWLVKKGLNIIDCFQFIIVIAGKSSLLYFRIISFLILFFILFEQIIQ